MAVSPSAIPGGGPAPEPQGVIARVEVRDAETEVYIPGADVSVIFSGGKASKKTDIGGNAAFSRNNFTGTSPETLKNAIYRIEKPGYESQEKPFVEGQITSFALPRAKTMIAPGTPSVPSTFPTTTMLVVGSLAAAGLVAFLAFR